MPPAFPVAQAPAEPRTSRVPAQTPSPTGLTAYGSQIPEAPVPSAHPATAAPVDPTSLTEQWVYVDPGSYSDPDTSAPVYTSGPQAIPTHAPATPMAPPPPGSLGAAAATTQQFALLEAQTHQYPLSESQTGGGTPPQVDRALAADYQPEPGELKIKERRSWKTWQLMTAVVLAAFVGMWFNGNAGSASSSASSGAGYKLPPSSGASGATATTAPGAKGSTGAPAGSSTTTTTGAGESPASTTAGGSTATTAAGAAGAESPTTTVAVGPAMVLVPETQQSGNWTSPAFTIAGGTWNIGWAYQCAPAPAAAPAFQIFAVNNGGTPGASPAVTSAAASGNSVTPLTSAGSQQVIVQTSAACRWAVKVTGSSS